MSRYHVLKIAQKWKKKGIIFPKYSKKAYQLSERPAQMNRRSR